MATLYISEFTQGVSGIGTTWAQIPPMPPVAGQNVAIAGASGQSAAFNARTKAVRVATDTPCNIAVGDNPVATGTDLWLAVNTSIVIAVAPGWKLAVIGA